MYKHFSLQCSQKVSKSSTSHRNASYKASMKSSPSAKKGRSEMVTKSSTTRLQAARNRRVRSDASKASGAVNSNNVSNSIAASNNPALEASGVPMAKTSSSSTPLKTNDTPILTSTPETISYDTDTITTIPCVEPSQEERDAGLRASMKAIHQPELTFGTVLTPSPLVCLPDRHTPFQHPSQLGYFLPSATAIEPTPKELAATAKFFQGVAQYEEPKSALQRTPQLCLTRLGGGNTHSSDNTYFQTTVKYNRETRLYGRSTWQTVEYSLRFDLHPEASSVCTSDKLPKAPLEKQLSDDLAPHKTDTHWVEDTTQDVSGAGALLSKAVSYVSQFTQLLRRVSSRWSSSSA